MKRIGFAVVLVLMIVGCNKPPDKRKAVVLMYIPQKFPNSDRTAVRDTRGEVRMYWGSYLGAVGDTVTVDWNKGRQP